MADLAGRTILSTGKGTTPEYVLRYILTQNGIDPDQDVTIEFYSEAAEVTAQMAVAEDAIAVLPQPYVTSASMQDDTLRVALDLTAEWEKVCDTQLITGVTVVRTAYAEEHPDVGGRLPGGLRRQRRGSGADLDGTAALCEEQGVVAKAAIAKAALPACNIVCITGEEMQADVGGLRPGAVRRRPPPLWAARCRTTGSTGCDPPETYAGRPLSKKSRPDDMCVRSGHIQGNLALGVCEPLCGDVRGSAPNFVPKGILGGRNFCPAHAGRNGSPPKACAFATRWRDASCGASRFRLYCL